jgi:NAD(P)-dependent dehydrogenase (short-subunit alcohol dehydrogenase family)
MTKTNKQASKVWFITGAASGFGRALAEQVIARGEKVVLAARNVAALSDLVERAPERVLAVRLDVTAATEIHTSLAQAVEHFGAVDVLVNNAGYSLVGALEETSDGELRALMETMFFGAAALTRAVVPQMRARENGTIVQITSVGGVATSAGFGAYCAAKHALEALSEALQKEVAPFGVRVLIVEPGAFRTSLFGTAFRSMPAIDAYAPTVGPVRSYAARSAGAQPGDPAKAARAIIDAVYAGAPNLRLPLGQDAVTGIREKLAEVARDVDATEAVAVATAFSAHG